VNRDLPLLGFGLPVSGAWATPSNMVHIAKLAENLGYETLWTFQRLLSPAPDIVDSRYVGQNNPSARSAVDPSYDSVLDPLAPLAYVAGHTDRIGLGTATICSLFTAPAVLAKSMSTVDILSNGRLTAGLGIGWMPHEYEAAGVPFSQRGARMDEYLRCLQALWTQDPVEFAGDFYTVPRSHLGISSVQRPHPPILLGGTAPEALRRAGRLAQGWLISSKADVEVIESSIALVRAGAIESDRNPDELRIVARRVVNLVDKPISGSRESFHGSRDQVCADLAALRASGVTEVFFDLNLSPRMASPTNDTGEAVAYAEHVLNEFAPASPARV